MDYHINERDELITLTASGSVTCREACACIDELLNDDNFDAQFPQLVDLRELQPEGSEEELKQLETFLLGDYRAILNAGVAIVVNPDWDQAVCAKAFWFSCALDRAETFDGWNQACKWLVQREFSSKIMELAGIESLTDDDGTDSDAPELSDTDARTNES